MQVSITNQKDHVINVVVFSFGLYLLFLVLLHGRLSLGPSLRFRRDSSRTCGQVFGWLTGLSFIAVMIWICADLIDF